MEASSSSVQDVVPNTRGRTYLKTDCGQRVPIEVIAARVPIYTQSGKGFIPFLNETAIDYIATQIKEFVENRFDCIVMISGARRKGKSTLGIQIARKVSTQFNVDQVAFKLEDFSAVLDKNPYADPAKGVYPQALLDEAGVGLYSKEWYATWQRNLVKCLEVIGIKRQICYFILPHARKLTGDIRDEMAYLWIDVDTKFQLERGYAELYCGRRDKFKQSIWWRPRFAFKFAPLEDDFWRSYEQKKILYVNEMAAGKLENTRVDPLADKIARDVAQGKSVQDIARELGSSRMTVYRYLKKLNLSSN